MTAEEVYRQRITRYRWDDLLSLWQSIEAANTPGWSPGKALEYLVLRAFELEDAEVCWPFSVHVRGDEIEQIDGVVYMDGLACLIECKDRAERVNVEPIAKLRNQLLQRPGPVLGIVFSRSGFTDPAVTLAQFVAPQTILLWDGDELAYALDKRAMRRGLLAKYRHCIEYGFPDYNIKIEDLL